VRRRRYEEIPRTTAPAQPEIVEIPSASVGAIPLEGEDLETTRWQDARHWVGIYSSLLSFQMDLMRRAGEDTKRLPPLERRTVTADLDPIQRRVARYEERLRLWEEKLWELHGPLLDVESRSVHHRGREVVLTNREFQLLQCLIANPDSYLTPKRILHEAWGDAGLSGDQVRNYIRRLRQVLRTLEVPADIINRPSQGYALLLRELDSVD